MEKNQRFKLIVIISSLTFIVLSTGLLVNALFLGDFARPGQPFYAGRSNLRIVLAFLMLGTVTLSLLRIVFRRLSSHAPTSSGAPVRNRKIRTEVKETADESVQAAGTTDNGVKIEHAGTRADSAQLLSETADELRSSVSVIQDELEEMIDEEIPADRERIETLYDEADRIRKIIEGMEQLSRAQSLARSLRKDPVELEPLLKGVIEKARQDAQDRNLTFGLDCESGLVMTGDPDCITGIIQNLVDNAAKAVADTGNVTLGAIRNGSEIVFSVRDTGTGIRRNHIPHLFERFFRGTGSGIGIGLAIVKELVDACGGKIEVQTVWGKGSVFTVRLGAGLKID